MKMRIRKQPVLVTILLALFVALNSSASAFRDTYPKNPGIDVLNYVFRIGLSDQSDEIECESTIDVRFLKAEIEELRIDLIRFDETSGTGMRIQSVHRGSEKLAFEHRPDHVLIKLGTPSKQSQRSKIRISYRGKPATGLKIGPNKHGERTFFSDNWPNKARNWLATVDHPYDKAMCEFVVTAPDHYQVISNGLLVEETDIGDGKRLTHWKQSVPIAPWLYVLGVARFAVQYVDEFEGKSIQTWVYHQDRDAGFYDFGYLTKHALQFYSDSVGPFSYEKLANIQSNSVGGGMEAASAIFYGDRSVTGTRSVRWRNVIIHEIAHQWFGNSVTEYDWDDVWLSEGFATYFTLLFIEHQYGRDAFVEGLESSKKRVDSFHEKNPDYRIVHNNLNDMKNVVTSQTYQKGSWILHMLRGVVGTENFWKGIRNYYAKYKDSSATTADFKREMEEVSGKDLTVFFDQWLYKPGALKVEGSWRYDDSNKQVQIDLSQVQNDGSLFKMPIEVGIYNDGSAEARIEKISLTGQTGSFLFTSEGPPAEVRLDPNYWVLMDKEFKRAQ
ncbi:MAG: M1 family metallopeptidase [Pyrinomonadaceae bacterium]|nr:M1 family metallopeptidase [Pyrinomonadaceae bacterium]